MDSENLIDKKVTTNENTIVNKDEYSFYNYLKEHPSFFIAIVSAIVAIISFVLNMASYIKTSTYLTYWWVDYAQININSSNQIYYVLGFFLYTVIALATNAFLIVAYEANSPYQKNIICYNHLVKRCNKVIKKSKKRLKKLDKSISHENIKNKQIIINEIENLKREVKEEETRKEQFFHFRKDTKKYNFLILLLCHIICFACNFFAFLLFVSIATINSDYDIPVAIAIALTLNIINHLTYGFLNKILIKVSMNRKIKKQHIDIKKEIKTDLPTSPIEKILFGKRNVIPTNKVFIRIIISLCAILIIIVSIFKGSGKSVAESQRDFFIVDDESGKYAVIYNNGEDMVLKRIEVSGNTLVVDLTEQKVISSKNVDMKKYHFDYVDTKDIEDSDTKN